MNGKEIWRKELWFMETREESYKFATLIRERVELLIKPYYVATLTLL
jgi:hypothetical protein